MPTSKERDYLKIAIDLAREAMEKGEAAFGAVIVNNDHILAASAIRHLLKKIQLCMLK